MASHQGIQQHLDNISEAGKSCLNDDPGSRSRLVSALTVAQREIEGPGAYLSRTRFAPLHNMCQLMGIEMGLLNAIVEAKGKPVTASEISERIGQEEQLIARVMRLLTVNGVYTEARVSTYKTNALAEFLNTSEQGGAIRNMVDLLFPIAGMLVPQLRSVEGLSQFPDTGRGVTPFRATYGPHSMFEYFNSHLEHKEAFDLFMTARTHGAGRRWFEIIAVQDHLVVDSSMSDDSVFLVDVGGGRGHDISSFKAMYPNIAGRCILQDLPSTLKDVKLGSGDIELMAHDFFTEQPVKGARVYVLKSVLHDWSDNKCHEILSQIANAMRCGYSKLLIEDIVLKDQGEGLRGASLDMLMFMMPEGIERTLSGFETLLNAAGLRLVRQWPGDEGMESVLEAEVI